ncbi:MULTISPECIES: hypothetical protein [unclassified Kitasatospora]|uniref:hypothetical protein n=1 Tax=unclassified Kitasatospora TaxID=2633591 RepID=UPI003411F59E
MQTAADATGLITWDVAADSTIAQAHRYPAGARKGGALQKEPPGGIDTEPDEAAVLVAAINEPP